MTGTAGQDGLHFQLEAAVNNGQVSGFVSRILVNLGWSFLPVGMDSLSLFFIK